MRRSWHHVLASTRTPSGIWRDISSSLCGSPHPSHRKTFVLYQEAVERVRKGASIASVLTSSDFRLERGEHAHDQFWRVLVNQSHDFTHAVAEDAIDTLIDYLPRYSRSRMMIEDYGRGRSTRCCDSWIEPVGVEHRGVAARIARRTSSRSHGGSSANAPTRGKACSNGLPAPIAASSAGTISCCSDCNAPQIVRDSCTTCIQHSSSIRIEALRQMVWSVISH
jgi:hypothetical protein